MSAQIIDGKAVSAEIKNQVKEQVETLFKKYGKRPGLAVIIVGDNPASKIYVSNKKKACELCSITSFEYALDEKTTQDELLALIDRLNRDESVSGILCQLPLPSHIDEDAVIGAISPDKDVDGFSPVSAGSLMLGRKGFVPCTPAGIAELIGSCGAETRGRHCVIIGRSNIVGKPMSMLMLGLDATVTVCHSKTRNLAEITKTADILIAAVGRAHFVTADMVKPGAVVIDVGINRNAEGKVTGDVDFDNVREICSAITPVPGGVGPMTIAMLMKNTLTAFIRQNGIE